MSAQGGNSDEPDYELMYRNQILFGYEPTGSNWRILKITGWRIFRKLVTGEGRGVLELGNPETINFQQLFLDKLKTKISPNDMVVTTVVDSHGSISYKIRFIKQQFDLVVATDAGALEFQTSPINLNSLEEKLLIS